MKRLSSLCVVAAVVGFAVAAFAADWPHFLGPDSNGFSPETGINKDWNNKKPAQLWRVPLDNESYAGPSVADGKVFIMDHKGDNDVVRALDLETGKPVWEFTYPEATKGEHGFVRSTPTFENGKLYTYSRMGVMHCLDAKNGKKLWSRDLVTELKGLPPHWQHAASPVIDGDNLMVTAGGAEATFVVLKKATGETVWNTGNNDASGYASVVPAVIGGQKQCLVLTGQNLVSFDLPARMMLWAVPFENGRKINAASPVVIGDMIFITSNYSLGSAMVKVAEGNAAIAWQNKDLQSRFSTPIVKDGSIYGIGEGFMVCIEAATGKTLWKQAGFEKGGLIGIDGVIIGIDGKDGDAVMVDMKPDACKELGRFKPLGGQSWTAPIAAGGKLIVRNLKELACFKLK